MEEGAEIGEVALEMAITTLKSSESSSDEFLPVMKEEEERAQRGRKVESNKESDNLDKNPVK